MSRKAQIEQMLADNPNDSFLLFALAKEYEKEEDWESAIEQYNKLAESDPSYLGRYFHHAAALIEIEGDESEIKQIYRQGIELANDTQDHHAKAELQNAFMNWEMEL